MTRLTRPRGTRLDAVALMALALVVGCDADAPGDGAGAQETPDAGVAPDGGGADTPSDDAGGGETGGSDAGGVDRGPAPAPAPDAAPPPDPDECLSDDDYFDGHMVPILSTDCIQCHRVGAPAEGTRYVLVPFDDDAATRANHEMLRGLVLDTDDGADLLIRKPTNRVSHGGGRRFEFDDPRVAIFQGFVERTRAPGRCDGPPPMEDPCAEPVPRPGSTPLRRLTDSQYRHAVGDLLGVVVAPGLFPETANTGEFRSFPSQNTVSSAAAESILLAAEHVAARVDVAPMLDCDAGDAADCARAALLHLTARAYRRPPTDAEAGLVARFVDAGLPPEEGLRMGIELLLQTPQFLYLDVGAGAPVGRGEAGAVHRVDDYAVAARLAAFLLDSTPDAELLAAAERGELSTRAQVAAQATRLVADARVQRALTAFHRDWLNTWQLDIATRDPDRYPEFGPHTVESIYTELGLFITEVVWGGDARFDTLMTSDATWIDSTLAPLYGLPDPGPGWHRVRLDAAERPGLLTRTAFLASHAYAGSSSPVRRGAFVLQELLCESLEPPADVNMDIPEPTEEARTIRERLEQHWTDGACSACHVRIDPLGFSFEHFGALGEWRDTWEDGTPVDATGQLEAPPAEFDGAAEMVERVARSETARSCYVTRWFEYAVGRPAEEADLCSLRAVQRRFEATDGDLRNLLVDLTLTDAFLYRREDAR